MGTEIHWLASANTRGMLVSETVLLSKFKEGPIKLDSNKTERFKRMWDRFQVNLAKTPQKALRKWIDFVLEELLEIEYASWITEGSSFERLKTNLVELQQTLAPKRALLGENDTPLLLLMEFPIDNDLKKPETETSRWRASPITKMERLLRETDCRLGLVSNGTQFGIIYAAPGQTTSHVIWEMQNLVEESESLEQFYTLLRQDAFLGSNETRLESLARESQRKQIDVTNQLGDQVLEAIETFIEQVDKCDRNSKGMLLDGVSPDDVYEMALVTMVRLIFLLYSEERGLLPHGHPVYDSNYGISHLIFELEGIRRETPEYLEQSTDAWERMTSTIRLIYSGSPHPDLVIKAYRGDLFNPDRFPTLESKLLSIPNSVVYRILRSLSFSETRVGGKRIQQRVSYRMLDVEQIGSVYEGLMEYKCRRANETLVVFSRGNQAIRPASELVSKKGKELLEYLSGVTGEKEDRIKARLDMEVDERRISRLPSELRRFHAIIRPKIIHKNQLYVTRAGSTRKGSGSYYTPKEITRFLVKQALREKVQFEDGRPKSPREILSLKACDPAMGSGAFLVQAARFLAERLVESWTAQEVDNPDVPLTIPYGDPLGQGPIAHPLPQDPEEANIMALRLVSESCLYGVDKNPLAVDIAKASLWLVTLSKDRPFTFLDHHLKHGDSLIGTCLGEIDNIPSIALPKAKQRDNDRVIEHEQSHLTATKTIDLALAIERAQLELSKPTVSINDRIMKEIVFNEIISEESAYTKLKTVMDLWCSVWFWTYGKPSILPPHTNEFGQISQSVIDYDDDLVSGKYKKKVLDHSKRIVETFPFFHWELEFPEVFLHNTPDSKKGFDVIITNPPWEIVRPNSQEFFSEFDPLFRTYKKQKAQKTMDLILDDEFIRNNWEEYGMRIDLERQFFLTSDAYPLKGKGGVNTYKLFIERTLQILNKNGRLSIIVPSEFGTDKGATDLRKNILDTKTLECLVSIENRGRIFNIHRSYRFFLLTIRNSGKTTKFVTAFQSGSRPREKWREILKPIELLSESYPPRIEELGPLLAQVPYHGLHYDGSIIRLLSPDSHSIVELKTQRDIDITLELSSKFPRLGDSHKKWSVKFNRGFHVTGDSELFLTSNQIDATCFFSKDTRCYYDESGNLRLVPLYEGKMIWAFDPYFANPVFWIRQEDRFIKSVPENLNDYRCGFRAISGSTNERTFICASIPRVPHVHSMQSMLFSPASMQNSLSLYMTAIMNSFVLDYLVRSRTTMYMSYSILETLPIPRIDYENWYFNQIISRSLRLTCISQEFEDLWSNQFKEEWKRYSVDNGGTSILKDWQDLTKEWNSEHALVDFESTPNGRRSVGPRLQLICELDALISHLYGISRDDLEHILSSFSIVKKRYPEIIKTAINEYERCESLLPS